MSRRGHHLTWRVLQDDTANTSLDAELQTIMLDSMKLTATVTRYKWVTVARGNPEDLMPIAGALNRARVTHFDISPEAKEMLYAHVNIDGTVDDSGKRVHKQRRKLPGRKVES